MGWLADDGHTLLFEYTSEALTQSLELSPLHLKLRAQAYGSFPAHLHRLPGLIADSLPDGWGLLLMDRLFRQQGLRHPGPLDRLAFIGSRAMGALRFIPVRDADAQEPNWNLLALAEESARALADEAGAALRELALTGGSPQGARPKALVQYDLTSGQVSTRQDAPGDPWLVKFPARGEHKEVCAIEQLYAELARDCGLDIPDSRWFDLSADLAAFGVARFDREVEKAYARTVFNVLFHNRDDHPKNFAWRLGRDRRWRLAPAFDLIFSEGVMGQHYMDICGEGAAIERYHLARLATEGGVQLRTAEDIIEGMLEQALGFASRFVAFPIRRATAQKISSAVDACRRRLKSSR